MSITTANFAIFNGNNLDTVPGLSVLKTDPYAPPKRKLSINELARTDKSKTNSAFYTAKNILVRVGISRINRNFLEQSIDTLMNLLQGLEKELVLPQAGAVRKYYCTLADMPVRKDGGSYIEIDLIFECSDRFGYETAYTTALNLSGITSSSRGDAIPFGGSAPWQVPVITIYYSAISGGTAKTVTIGNSLTGMQVSITRTWAAGDRIIIDAFNRTVTVNGADVAFSGAIPEWSPGLGNWTYTDGFTTRTFNASIIYYKRYI